MVFWFKILKKKPNWLKTAGFQCRFRVGKTHKTNKQTNGSYTLFYEFEYRTTYLWQKRNIICKTVNVTHPIWMQIS